MKDEFIRAIYFPDYPDHDCIWSVKRAYDERIYFSLCSEGRAAIVHLMVYDPKNDEIEDLLDIGELTGDRLQSGKIPQSKIHTSLCPTGDYKIYGATHCTAPPPDEKLLETFSTYGDQVYGYTGSYIFCYDIKQKKADVLGIIPFEGVRKLELDEKRMILYAVSYPKHHIYSFDIQKRERKDLGRIGMLGAFDLFLDKEGRLFTTDDYGKILRYDVNGKKKIEELSISLPGVNWRRSPYNFLWYPIEGKDGKIYGTTYYDGHFFRYDPYEGEEGYIEDLGSGGEEDIKEGTWAAPYIQAPVFDFKNNIYYGYSSIWMQSHLFKLELASLRRTDLGVIDLDNIHSAFLADSCSSKDGRFLYFGDITMEGKVRLLIIDTKISGIQESKA